MSRRVVVEKSDQDWAPEVLLKLAREIETPRQAAIFIAAVQSEGIFEVTTPLDEMPEADLIPTAHALIGYMLADLRKTALTH